jgi:hypothetical protein
MRVNRGSTSGPAEVTDGSGLSAPEGSGAQREGADTPRSRTDRGNQHDEDVGSSAARGGGGEINAPRSNNAVDPDPMPDTADRFGVGGGSSGNPDLTGTKDVIED